MAREFPGWLHINAAAKQYGVTWAMLRNLVREGVLTRGRFTSITDAGPIYLKVIELEAWKTGGVDGVLAMRAEDVTAAAPRAERTEDLPEEAAEHAEVGGESGSA